MQEDGRLPEAEDIPQHAFLERTDKMAGQDAVALGPGVGTARDGADGDHVAGQKQGR